MKKFEEGKSYRVNGGGIITVARRTKNYVTFSGDFSGKKRIRQFDLFGLGENILITDGKFKKFCFAEHEEI